MELFQDVLLPFMLNWQALVRAEKRVKSGETPVFIHSKLLDESHLHHCLMIISAQKGILGAEWAAMAEVHFGLGECVRLDQVESSIFGG
jgi:hypothetical protein